MKKRIFLILLPFLCAVLVTACLEEKNGVVASTHTEDWSKEGSDEFHGAVLLSQSLSLESCASCHGVAFDGGTSKISCYESGCHNGFPHPPGFADMSAADFHGEIISDVLNWDILSCQTCHGQSYNGAGFQQKNCLTCHTQPDGPEDCSTCHGTPGNPAPPRDLEDNQSTTARGVGAHQAHVSGTTWTKVLVGSCETCHTTPHLYSSAGHIDESPGSEIVFDDLAVGFSELQPVWSRMDASCSNVYCHGSFTFKQEESNYSWAYTDTVMSGNNPTMFWKYVETGQALCGSCHGLPPAGHIENQACYSCHNSVVDENLNIINKFLHINGKVDVF